LAPETAFAFLNLDDQTIQMRLSQGSLNLRVRQLGESEVFEIDTPNVTVSVLRPGLYRVDVDARGNTTVTDRIGEAEVTASNSAFTVHPRQTATVTGIDSLVYDIQDAYAPDNWDNWCSARDQREDKAASARYVSREMIGYEDLDEYGVWRVVPEYGPVWVPSRSRRIGRRIAMAIGSGQSRGAGPGWMTRLGDSRHFITAAGPTLIEVGSGFRAAWWRGLSMPRRSSLLSVAATGTRRSL